MCFPKTTIKTIKKELKIELKNNKNTSQKQEKTRKNRSNVLFFFVTKMFRKIIDKSEKSEN